VSDEPQVDVVNQSRGLEGLARFLAGRLPPRQLAKLAVDQRHEPVWSRRISLAPGAEEPRHLTCRWFGHRRRPPCFIAFLPRPSRMAPDDDGFFRSFPFREMEARPSEVPQEGRRSRGKGESRWENRLFVYGSEIGTCRSKRRVEP